MPRREQMATAKEMETEVQNTVVDEAASLGVRRYFTIPGRDPFDEIEWETRDAFIPGKDKPAFEQKGVEFPKFWSQTATNIVAQKYFRGRMASPEREFSVKQMIGRVVTTIGRWGRDGGYFGSWVEATADHVVKAVHQRRTMPEWLRVDELVPGMRMHLHPHRAKAAAPVYATAGPVSVWVEPIEEPIDHVRVAEAALAGWLQADGFVGQYAEGTNRSLTIEFQVATDDEYEWVIRHLDLAFPDVYRNVREVATKDESLHCRRIRLYGEPLREFVEEWGLLARGTEIRVPARLWTASHDEIVAYLRSIFQADGYVSVRRQNGNENG